jgi:hypothetical protein
MQVKKGQCYLHKNKPIGFSVVPIRRKTIHLPSHLIERKPGEVEGMCTYFLEKHNKYFNAASGSFLFAAYFKQLH